MHKLTGVLASRWLVCVTAVFFLAVPLIAHAEYEIDISKVTANVPTDGTIVQWTQDLRVEWEQPAMAGGDVLQGFVYKWNSSATALDDTGLNVGNADGTVEDDVIPPFVTKPAADLANDDSDLFRYFHIKTWYLDVSPEVNAPVYSSDRVIGPINIDNVPPSGSVRITDADGNDISTTISTTLDLRLAAALGPVNVYLNETPTRPAEGAAYTTVTGYTLGDETPGQKTIYAWFEDGAGNISTALATDTVTLLPAVSISPYAPTVDVSTGTQVFKVDGTTDNYDWVIQSQVPKDAGNTVAQFSGGSTGTNSVTVELLNAGTFQLQATPSTVGTVLTSGTITVTGAPCVLGDVDSSGSVDITDVLMVIDFIFGKTPTAAEFCAANVDDTNQSIDISDLLKMMDIIFGG